MRLHQPSFRSVKRVALAVFAAAAAVATAYGANDAYSPSGGAAGDAYSPGEAEDTYSPPARNTYEPYRPLDGSRRGGRSDPGYGEPYPAEAEPTTREERYESVPPPEAGGPPIDDYGSRGTYSQNEVIRAGHGFFGSVSSGLAQAVEWTFQKAGRPNGYVLGQDAGGAVVAGLRYGEGTLYTKDAGEHKVFWQGPSVGYDLGAEGSKVMTLVYNLRDVSDIYNRFGGVEGSAYLVGGVSVTLQKAGEVTLAPIRAGVGLRLGANVGYLKYTRQPTWNPF